MKTSEKINLIIPAIIAAHAKMTQVNKTAESEFHKADYVELVEIVRVTRPILEENNLAILQFPCFENGCVGVTSRIIHESGEWIEETASAGALPPDAQKAGAAITYLRKYSLMGICGLAPKDDDSDPGQFTGKNKKKPKNGTIQQKAATPEKGAMTEDRMRAILKGLPEDVKEGLRLCNLGIAESYQLYKAANGDIVKLEKMIALKMKG